MLAICPGILQRNFFSVLLLLLLDYFYCIANGYVIIISLENKEKTGSHRKAHTKQKTHKI